MDFLTRRVYRRPAFSGSFPTCHLSPIHDELASERDAVSQAKKNGRGLALPHEKHRTGMIMTGEQLRLFETAVSTSSGAAA